MDGEIVRIFSLFFDHTPIAVRAIETSRDEDDFRAAYLIETDSGHRFVLKLAQNDFTYPEKIDVWKRTAEEYRRLGYYCPRIFPDRTGRFPTVDFGGHRCVAYAEEYAPYRPAAHSTTDDTLQIDVPQDSYRRDVWRMTALVAAQHFEYTDHPSAWCLFDTFCPSDERDEVLENALAWKAYADTLPPAFQGQVGRIWRLWTENRAALEPIYRQLPTSVFQADLNPTNILLDDTGRFVGVFDFNLCGREVFLNYLMRENYGDFQREIVMIRDALRIASQCYRFSDAEKDAALALYRCLKPLSFISLESLKEAGTDPEAIQAFLDETERCLTAPIDFRGCMG